ncbi:MAG: LysR family transcriptional regulator [Burkholderiales bacterium]|nr:LysR family transcriptional regulator [Burkholderiales bacterium]MBP9768384.1 LysR family transcriptional regulator [Burkholderiales bacterium]
MLDDIMLYLTVYEQQSFKKAAELLKVKASTLSYHINELENRLGNRLIIRTSKMFQPTEFGTYVYNQFRHVPDFVDFTFNRYKDSQQVIKVNGAVNIALGETIAYKHIVPKLNNFLEKHPGLKLNITFLSNNTQWPAKHISIVLAPVYIKGEHLINRFIRTEHVQLFCTSNYAATHGIPETIENILEHNIIGLIDEQLKPFNFLKAYNIHSKQEYLLDFSNNCLNINSGVYHYNIGMKTSDYIFCSHRSMMEDDIRKGKIISILPSWGLYELNFHLVSYKNISFEEQVVIDFISKCLRE